jgi:hypothetical protein
MIEFIFCGKPIPSSKTDVNPDEAFCSDVFELEFRKKVGLPTKKRIIGAIYDGANLALINKKKIIRIRVVD